MMPSTTFTYVIFVLSSDTLGWNRNLHTIENDVKNLYDSTIFFKPNVIVNHLDMTFSVEPALVLPRMYLFSSCEENFLRPRQVS